jgi:hypothetical protein
VQRARDDQQPSNMIVTVNPAIGGMAIASTPLTIMSTLSAIDHAVD